MGGAARPTNPEAGGDPNLEPGDCESLKAASDGIYYIGSADDLKEFACTVNNSNVAFTGTAKLTADIFYLGSAKLLNDAGDGLASSCNSSTQSCAPLVNGEDRSWTPLKNFAGEFDGQNYTIYGLYASRSDGAGFTSNIAGDATVKNLHIADSYFYSNVNDLCIVRGNNTECPSGAGGIAAYTEKDLNVTLEMCGFSGVVNGSKSCSANDICAYGGLIGAVGGSPKKEKTLLFL